MRKITDALKIFCYDYFFCYKMIFKKYYNTNLNTSNLYKFENLISLGVF